MRRETLYLKDALHYARRVSEYGQGFDLDRLPEDPMRLDAILRGLQIIGEAVKNIPVEMRSLRPEIPWTKIAGIRNRLVHHYFRVDLEVIVDICRHHIEPLIEALEAIDSEIADPFESSSVDPVEGET